MDRLVDLKIEKYLKIFKAVQIVGPKWCGKTWTSLAHGNSIIKLTDDQVLNYVKLNPREALKMETPEVIDEWQILPNIWDSVRNECDDRVTKGNFILTGSTTLLSKESKSLINHSGTGRIIELKMYPMSCYEMGNSYDLVSLMDMYDGNVNFKMITPIKVEELAKLIIAGGWPENAKNDDEEVSRIIAREYFNSVVNRDIDKGMEVEYSPIIMRSVIESLARNESTYVSNKKIVKDVFNEKGKEVSEITLKRYLDILKKLYLTNDQKAFSINYRSNGRVCKSNKRHMIDPSIACAALGLTSKKLLSDFNLFGFMFESLVYRDLSIFMDYYGGSVSAFRDNLSGDEVDAILEFDDGEYAAVEIKLGQDGISDAIKSLSKFEKNVAKKPKFMVVIVGVGIGVTRDLETGIYVVPFNALGMHLN